MNVGVDNGHSHSALRCLAGFWWEEKVCQSCLDMSRSIKVVAWLRRQGYMRPWSMWIEFVGTKTLRMMFDGRRTRLSV